MSYNINQCQGCQAGWPLNTKEGYHQVIGGYLGEVVSCTKGDYILSDRVKATKAYQLAGEVLPPQIWLEVSSIAGELGVDLNSVTDLGGGMYLIGHPRTELTILATKSFAKFHKVRQTKEGVVVL